MEQRFDAVSHHLGPARSRDTGTRGGNARAQGTFGRSHREKHGLADDNNNVERVEHRTFSDFDIRSAFESRMNHGGPERIQEQSGGFNLSSLEDVSLGTA